MSRYVPLPGLTQCVRYAKKRPGVTLTPSDDEDTAMLDLAYRDLPNIDAVVPLDADDTKGPIIFGSVGAKTRRRGEGPPKLSFSQKQDQQRAQKREAEAANPALAKERRAQEVARLERSREQDKE